MDPYGPFMDLLVPTYPWGSLCNYVTLYSLFDQPWSYMVMYDQPGSFMDLLGPLWVQNDPVLSQNKEKEKLHFALTYALLHKFCGC